MVLNWSYSIWVLHVVKVFSFRLATVAFWIEGLLCAALKFFEQEFSFVKLKLVTDISGIIRFLSVLLTSVPTLHDQDKLYTRDIYVSPQLGPFPNQTEGQSVWRPWGRLSCSQVWMRWPFLCVLFLLYCTHFKWTFAPLLLCCICSFLCTGMIVTHWLARIAITAFTIDGTCPPSNYLPFTLP